MLMNVTRFTRVSWNYTFGINKRRLSSSFQIFSPTHEYVDTTNAPKDFDEQSAVVFADIITEGESDSLVNDVMKRMKRKRWERGHWDAVISYYKETELDFPSENKAHQIQVLSSLSENIIERIRNHILRSSFAENQNISWLPVHAIHLHKEGILSAHVDSVKFSGTVVCGLSLLSDCIMRLRPTCPSESPDLLDDKSETSSKHVKSLETDYVDLYLPRRSLYILSGTCRYRYTHEILSSGASFRIRNKNEIIVDRDDRISLIFRDSKVDK